MDQKRLTYLFTHNGFEVEDVNRLPNNTGFQYRLAGGGIVNLYDNGRFNVQGKNPKAVAEVLQPFQPRVRSKRQRPTRVQTRPKMKGLFDV